MANTICVNCDGPICYTNKSGLAYCPLCDGPQDYYDEQEEESE